MRVHMAQKRMTFAQADTLLYYLHSFKYVTSVQVRERTGDAIICYVGDREAIIDRLRKFHYEDVEMPEGLIENSGRKVNQEYQDKLVYKVLFHYARKFLLPYPLRVCYTGLTSIKYIKEGLQTLAARKIEVPVLDATAISISMLRGDFNTAGSVMFLLGIGELLGEWTHKVDRRPGKNHVLKCKQSLVKDRRSGDPGSGIRHQRRRPGHCTYGKCHSV